MWVSDLADLLYFLPGTARPCGFQSSELLSGVVLLELIHVDQCGEFVTVEINELSGAS